MRVIGIDPGTAIVGYGIIDYENNKYSVVDYGVILTDKELKIEDRLEIIYNRLYEIIEKYKPTKISIEDLFYFKNNKTVISVAQARGIIILVAKKNNLEICSYTPLQVKMGITGYGKADKKQVQTMVQRILNLKEIPKPDDAADALAVAVTHINFLNSILNKFSIEKNSKEKICINEKKNKISLEEYKKIFMK